MNYYKLINGTNFVGIATQHSFREYQQKHGIVLACNAERAQYIQCNENFYRADWMVPTTTDSIIFDMAEIIEIDEEEYNTLYDAIENGKEISPEPDEDTGLPEVPVVDAIEEVTVDYLKSAKIAEMSSVCNKTITSGFDVILSDKNTYHFSLTTQDQLNLITLASMVANGETHIPYHADNELCRFYSAEDINTIIMTATNFKTYQVSYFNALKMYIESLRSKKTVSSVKYGMEIPEKYQSEVLKVMLANTRNNKNEETA